MQFADNVVKGELSAVTSQCCLLQLQNTKLRQLKAVLELFISSLVTTLASPPVPFTWVVLCLCWLLAAHCRLIPASAEYSEQCGSPELQCFWGRRYQIDF